MFQAAKWRSGIRAAPAIQGAKIRTNGTNRAPTSDLPPCRAKNSSTRSTCCCRGQPRATSRSSSGRPPIRPISYPPSAPSVAAIAATAITSSTFRSPAAAAAPAPIRIVSDGNGTPTSSSVTVTNTSR